MDILLNAILTLTLIGLAAMAFSVCVTYTRIIDRPRYCRFCGEPITEAELAIRPQADMHQECIYVKYI